MTSSLYWLKKRPDFWCAIIYLTASRFWWLGILGYFMSSLSAVTVEPNEFVVLLFLVSSQNHLSSLMRASVARFNDDCTYSIWRVVSLSLSRKIFEAPIMCDHEFKIFCAFLSPSCPPACVHWTWILSRGRLSAEVGPTPRDGTLFWAFVRGSPWARNEMFRINPNCKP